MNPDTLLETIRCEGGVAYHLDYHQKRLDATLRKLNGDIQYNLIDLIIPPDAALYRCRFLYDTSAFAIEYHPYVPKKITSLRLIYDDTIDYSLKYANRTHLDTLYALRNGCDDVLIAKNTSITDTTLGNVAFLLDNQWLTPDTPLLEGTTRARLLDEGKIQPARLNVSDIIHADKIMVMNAMVGCIEIENDIII